MPPIDGLVIASEHTPSPPKTFAFGSAPVMSLINSTSPVGLNAVYTQFTPWPLIDDAYERKFGDVGSRWERLVTLSPWAAACDLTWTASPAPYAVLSSATATLE